MKLIKILFCLFLLIPSYGFAANYYIAQSAAGSGDGSTCGNAEPISYLTGSWSGKVAAGDTVHLCGTLTSALTIGGSGSDNTTGRITIKFETGAKFSKATWDASGAIYAESRNYILIDGGTNGTIEATNNGTLLANQATSQGIYVYGSDHIEVKNLTISNLYVHPNMQGSGSVDAAGIRITGGSSNVSVHDCIIHDAPEGIAINGASFSNAEFYLNIITNCAWGITVVPQASATAENVKIHNNDITMGMNWPQSDGAYHLNGMYLYGDEAGNSTTFTNTWIYNNYIHGPSDPTYPAGGSGWIHFDYTNATGTRIFNNLLVGVTGDPSNGYLAFQKLYDTGGAIYNNTIIGLTPHGDYGSAILTAQNAHPASWTIKNNIFMNQNTMVGWPGGDTTFLTDYNSYYGYYYLAAGFGTWYDRLSTWQAALSGGSSDCPTGVNHECNGIATNPDLNTNYTPKVTSPVVGAGVNLTSLCGTIPELCLDRNGVARPASGAWDIGAYQYEASGTYYTVTTSATNGTVSPSNPSVLSGAAQAFTNTPTNGYTFTGWSGTCGCTGTGTCNPTITAACTVTASNTATTSAGNLSGGSNSGGRF